jgi:non-heme chloroperoxidase
MAQTVTGIWQGVLPGGVPERLVLTISNGQSDGVSSALYAVDHAQSYELGSTAFAAGKLRFRLPEYGASYEGNMSSDGTTIVGTWKWSDSGTAIPLTFNRATEQTSWAVDRTAHKISFITVEPGIRLEVVDWGGMGRPLVLLSGLGDNAHVFDTFAPKLTSKYHVYGITRRGFGASSVPQAVPEDFSADRLGDDVLAVVQQLKLNHPVLVGHSIAGEELSSIGSRHPEDVAGLIYLGTGSPYAMYVHSPQSVLVDWDEMARKVRAITDAPTPQQQRALIVDMLHAELPQYEQELKDRQTFLMELPDEPPPPTEKLNSRSYRVTQAVHDGEQKYTQIKCPLLAIFNEPIPTVLKPDADEKTKARAEREKEGLKQIERQEQAARTLGANAHVVSITGGSHYIFRSNEADVLRDMDEFIAELPQ